MGSIAGQNRTFPGWTVRLFCLGFWHLPHLVFFFFLRGISEARSMHPVRNQSSGSPQWVESPLKGDTAPNSTESHFAKKKAQICPAGFWVRERFGMGLQGLFPENGFAFSRTRMRGQGCSLWHQAKHCVTHWGFSTSAQMALTFNGESFWKDVNPHLSDVHQRARKMSYPNFGLRSRIRAAHASITQTFPGISFSNLRNRVAISWTEWILFWSPLTGSRCGTVWKAHRVWKAWCSCHFHFRESPSDKVIWMAHKKRMIEGQTTWKADDCGSCSMVPFSRRLDSFSGEPQRRRRFFRNESHSLALPLPQGWGIGQSEQRQTEANSFWLRRSFGVRFCTDFLSHAVQKVAELEPDQPFDSISILYMSKGENTPWRVHYFGRHDMTKMLKTCSRRQGCHEERHPCLGLAGFWMMTCTSI